MFENVHIQQLLKHDLRIIERKKAIFVVCGEKKSK